MNVDIINQQTSLPIKASQVKRLVKTVIAFENKKFDEVAIHFVDTDRICELHIQYFDDPTSTDCISFPMDGDEVGYRMLGDSFICPATALKYVAEHGGDPYQEVTLYIVHSLLHLMGYDDIDKSDKIKMRTAEKRHIAHLQELGYSLKE